MYGEQPVYEEQPVYKWHAYWICNVYGTRFNDEVTCADHCIFECGGSWTVHKEKVQTGTKKVQVGTKKVQVRTK